MRVDVNINERVLVMVDGQPRAYLGPGRHRRFYGPLAKVELKWLDTNQIVAELRPELLARVPAQDLRILKLGAYQRAVVYRRGRPVSWLVEGEHQVFTPPDVTIEVFDVSGLETAPLRDELRALAPKTDYVETTAAEGSAALRYVDGALEAVLGPGRHASWTARRKVTFAVIDVRERVLQITGQEVMTKDRVTLRLNLSVSYGIADVRRLATVARAPDEVLYLAVQLAARESIAARTLDELLASREELGEGLRPAVATRAADVGLSVTALGLRDFVLPGEMKALLNRVIEAQKEAEANVILRREETAATRSMAQTAKVLAENPLLVRLKELEAYKELAAKVGQVHLVMGEAGLPKLELKA
jgi:regulator of protease activity HflC (stomatin/prohibitin superfamily)